MTEQHTLLSGLVVGESPRWHDGRLWFSNWGAEQIMAVDLNGSSEVIAAGPRRAGFSIDWLPDGRLLVTGDQLLRREADGTFATHADLSSISAVGWNEIAVDGRGNIYTNSINFLWGEQAFRPGYRARDSGRQDASGRRQSGFPEWHGRDARQCHAHRGRVVHR